MTEVLSDNERGDYEDRIKELEAENGKLQEANGHYLAVCKENQGLEERIEVLESKISDAIELMDEEPAKKILEQALVSSILKGK